MINRDCSASSTFHLSPNVSEKPAFKYRSLPYVNPIYFKTLVRLCNFACRFECNPVRNPTDRFVHDQAIEHSGR